MLEMNFSEPIFSIEESISSSFLILMLDKMENFLTSYDFYYWFRAPFYPHFSYSVERKLFSEGKNVGTNK